jgi:hypothetical protein
MAITTLTLRPLAPGLFRLEYASDLDAPTFYVWRDDTLIAQTTARSTDVSITTGDAPTFDVFDDADTRPARHLPTRAVLTWYRPTGTPAATAYRIDQLNPAGTAWTTVDTVQGNGRQYLTWESTVLADGFPHSFRVIPLSLANNPGTVTELTVLMVRKPTPPAFRAVLNDLTGDIVVSVGAGTTTGTVARPDKF